MKALPILSGLIISLGVSQQASAQYSDIVPRPLFAEEHGGILSEQSRLIPVLSADSLQTLIPSIERSLEKLAFRGGKKLLLHLSCTDTLSFSKSREAYRLVVKSGEIRIEGRSLLALNNALQTLRQLRTEQGIPCGVVEDAPAFRWRGFMVDVGRNYESMDLLKEQIDEMAALKLNVFHFHLTEDVAWRMESRRYPQLNDPATMTRDKGLYYRFEELRELQEYCRERFILLVPEFDMPGHSAAFKRALGYDMQSEEGLRTVLELMDEVLDACHFPIIHIGADEVRIHNKDFVPTVTKLLEERGVRVMGWSPGGNYPSTVIRQLWSAAEKSEIDNPDVYKVDSRNLYINHMDALESVVSIYYHSILDGETDLGDEHRLGGELCLWNDRNLFYGDLNNLHNPTYPSMIAFAEKTWCGGGYPDNYVSLSTDRDLEGFRDFERRLCLYGQRHMVGLPFPYVAQADIEWKIYGPYDNGGDTSKVFPVERMDEVSLASLKADTTFIGGTLIFRHFWTTQIKGLWTSPAPNQTVYASRQVWSDTEREVGMWIGFYDYSRSQWPDAPQLGEWNDLSAKIWLNGAEIAPPLWAHAGQKADLEIPFYDENYSMRRPTRVTLRKGWNTILLKVPVASFVGKAWYAPVKWMATAVIVDEL